MTIDQLESGLLIGSAVLLAAVVAVRLSSRTGLPSLLLYLALGLLLGEGGLGVQFEDAELTSALGYLALILILAEGGLTTRWTTIRPSVLPAAALATVGTTVSVLVTGAAAHWVLAMPWELALLLGATISSTDAAAVFSVLRRVPLPPRLVGMLEAESGFNDAPVVIAVVALTDSITRNAGHGWLPLVSEAALELVLGAVVGLVIGRLGAISLARIALPAPGLYPIAVLGLILGGYGLAVAVHGSGFLAVYLTALALGNARLPHGAAVRSFAEGLGWLAQIGLFVLLGLLASPSRLLEQLGPAVAIGLVLLLVARPLSVLLSVGPFGLPLREQAFLSWAGLRGAVPIVLTTIPVAAAVPGSTGVFDLVFVLVVIFTLLQAPSLPWVAAKLGLTGSVATVGLDLESSPLGALGADVLEVHVGPQSRLHGVEIFELRLPAGANVTMVLREGDGFVPTPQTVLRHADVLIVVAVAAVRDATEDRLRAVSAGGKLQGWRAPGDPARAPGGVRRISGRGRVIGRRAAGRGLGDGGRFSAGGGR